jgi:hypothetical protein
MKRVKRHEWENRARDFFVWEDIQHIYGTLTPVLVIWRRRIYPGEIGPAQPAVFKDAVILAKSPDPFYAGVAAAVKKLDKNRAQLYADTSLDLTGIVFVLRRLKNRLTKLTAAQEAYFRKHPVKYISTDKLEEFAEQQHL